MCWRGMVNRKRVNRTMKRKILRVNEDTYCLYTPSYYNCTYLIHRNDEIIFIDTGMNSDALDVKIALRNLKLDHSKIKAVLLTHWHNDHSAGTSVVKELSQCTVYAHSKELPYFQKKQSNPFRRLADYIPEWGIFVLFKGLIGDTVPKKVKVDRIVQNGDIVLGDFEVIETPGHTSGHVAYYDIRTKTLFAGDSLAVIDGRLRLMARPVTPDKPAARNSIVRMLSGRETNTICPGHRNPLTENVDTEIKRFLHYLQSHPNSWPLFG